MSKFKVVHYINQFYAGIGGEEKANTPPSMREGFVGPGMAFSAAFGDEATITATIVCGDSYFNENLDSATNEILEMIKQHKPDLFIAGPAFNAGRYGTACGAICKAVQEQLGIPVVTGMYVENPGVDLFRKDLYIVETSDSAAGMRKAVTAMAKLAMKMLMGEQIKCPDTEGYIKRGVRRNFFDEKIGAQRAVDMLVKKLSGAAFTTEYEMPVFDHVPPAKAIVDLSKAKIGLVTSGGIVPKGNPDRIESSSASKYGKYDLSGVQDLTWETFETAHGGYDPVYANADADCVLPVDAMRFFEKEGKIGSLHNFYYATVGNGTAVKSADSYADEIAKELLDAKVDGIILTST